MQNASATVGVAHCRQGCGHQANRSRTGRITSIDAHRATRHIAPLITGGNVVAARCWPGDEGCHGAHQSCRPLSRRPATPEAATPECGGGECELPAAATFSTLLVRVNAVENCAVR